MAGFGKKSNKSDKRGKRVPRADAASEPTERDASSPPPNLPLPPDPPVESVELSAPKPRIFRNPSGRSARIAPELRPITGEEPIGEPLETKGVEPLELSPVDALAASDSEDPNGDFSWAQVTGSYRRERSIEGLLLGSSVGEALGLGRSGLSRKSSIRIMGRGPLTYCLIPGLGIVGSDTHRVIMTLQSILRSRSQMELFRRNLAFRLRFYVFSFPVTAGATTILASLRLWLGVPADQSGLSSVDNSPLINALAIATVLQGTGHSVERWVAVSTEVTQIRDEVVDAAVLMARTAHLAIMTPSEDWSAVGLIDRLAVVTESAELTNWLKEIRIGLEEGLSPHGMASRLGWQDQIPTAAGPTAVMAIYCWMRHHQDYEKAVEQAILLGGDSSTLGALAGGLAGIHLGAKKIPERWLSRLWTWPNHRRWLESLTRRITDWPHGSEDLHAAPAMPARAFLQLVRSCVLTIGVAIGSAVKIPWKLSHWIIG